MVLLEHGVFGLVFLARLLVVARLLCLVLLECGLLLDVFVLQDEVLHGAAGRSVVDRRSRILFNC